MGNETYKHIDGLFYEKHLKSRLTKSKLRIVDDIVEAYLTGRITLVKLNHNCTEIKIIDQGYKETGVEALVIKWYLGLESMDYMCGILYDFRQKDADDVIKKIFSMLPKEPRSYDVNNDPGFWTNGDLILCPSETECEIVADFLEDVLSEFLTVSVITGHFDPKEDERNHEHDRCSGFYYIDFQ